MCLTKYSKASNEGEEGVCEGNNGGVQEGWLISVAMGSISRHDTERDTDGKEDLGNSCCICI